MAHTFAWGPTKTGSIMEGALGALKQEVLRHTGLPFFMAIANGCVYVGTLQSSLLLPNDIDTQEGETAWQDKTVQDHSRGFYHAQEQRNIHPGNMTLTNL